MKAGLERFRSPYADGNAAARGVPGQDRRHTEHRYRAVDCRERSGWSACSDPAAFARANVLNEAFAPWNASFRAIPFAPVLPWRAVKAASMTARAADVPQPPWWYSMRG